MINYKSSLNLLKVGIVCCSAMAFVACSTDDDPQSVLGSPIPISINIEGVASVTTRTATPMTTGTAYLTAGGVPFKRYSYNNTLGAITSANPLVWTSLDPVTVYGYYIDVGETMPNSINGPEYTVNSTSASFLAGKDIVKFDGDGYPNSANLVLRQQLAKITVTVVSLDGSTISEPMLGGGRLYTSGEFDPTSFSDNGYANGGTNNTGWIPTTNLDPTTVPMETDNVNSTGNTYVFYAYVLPQQFSNTSVNFFTIKVTSGTLVHNVSYRLNEGLTFVAGGSYKLEVDNVTNALFLNTGIIIDDIAESDNSNLIDNGDVDSTDPNNNPNWWYWIDENGNITTE